MLDQLQISVNINKWIFCAPFVVFLGHIVFKDGLLVDPSKITIIVDLLAPTLVQELVAYFGHTRYYGKFLCNYAMITVIIMPLDKIL